MNPKIINSLFLFFFKYFFKIDKSNLLFLSKRKYLLLHNWPKPLIAAPLADIDSLDFKKFLFSIKKISLFLSIIF